MSVLRVLNLLPRLVLSSPLHRFVGANLLLLTWTGRRSGRRFTTPVMYRRDGGDLVLTTDSAWWKNFRSPARVRVRLHGRAIGATAVADTDPAELARVLRWPPDRAAAASRHGRVVVRLRPDSPVINGAAGTRDAAK